MGDEHDSWFKPFGFDPGKAAAEALASAKAKAAVALQAVKEKGVVAAVTDEAKAVATSVKAKVTAALPGGKPAAKPAAPTSAPSPNGAAGSVSSLTGSVGAGGKNNPDDVKVVQTALKIDVDGKCGPATIAAIKAFQKSIGQGNPDGRVDAGGATSKALAGRAAPAPAPAPVAAPDAPPAPAPDAAPAPKEEGFFEGLKNKAVKKLEDVAGAVKDFPGNVVKGVTDLGGKVAAGAAGLGGNSARADFSAGGIKIPKLSLDQLSKEQIETVQKFLAAHLTVGFTGFGAPELPASYGASLKGKRAAVDEIVQALKAEISSRPLQNPTAELKELVEQRIKELVAPLVAAAKKAADFGARIIAQLKSGGNPSPELAELSKMDMRAILDVMAKIKQAGKLDEIKVTLNERLSAAFLTISGRFDDVAWEQSVAKLSPEDRKAVLERTPAKFAAQFEKNEGANASQEEAQQALNVFLEKVQKAQGGSTLRVSDTVRVAGNAVAFGIPNSDTKIKSLLARKDLTGTPAVLAQEIASRLPPSIPRSNLKRLAGLPVDEASGTQAQTFLAALVAGVVKEVDKIIKGLPKAVQDEIRKAVGDAIEAGVLAVVAQAMSDSKLDDDSKNQIKSIVGAAIKQHPSQSSFDNRQGTEGSPDARDRPPPVPPTQPEQPPITDEQKFKGPEIKTPDGPPPNPKPPEKPDKP